MAIMLSCSLLTILAYADQDQRYCGFSLPEWHQIMKSIDFKTLGRPETVQCLTLIVSDEKAPWASRRMAAKTLGRIGEPAADAVPVLKKLLRSPGEEPTQTRLWVLGALALFKTTASEVVPDVSQLILDESLPLLVRINALETLGRVGQQSELALSTFGEILSSDDDQRFPDELRLAAAEAVWILGPSATPLLPLLIQSARDEWSPIRLAAIVTIGEIGPQAEIAVPTLIDTLLFDEAGEVKEVAADSLGRLGPSALKPLAQLQNDPDLEVRLLVIRALSQANSNQTVTEMLLKGLRDSATSVKIAAARELIQRDPDQKDAHVVLLTALGSNERRNRLDAYNTLSAALERSDLLLKKISELTADPATTSEQHSMANKLLKKWKFDQENE